MYETEKGSKSTSPDALSKRKQESLKARAAADGGSLERSASAAGRSEGGGRSCENTFTTASLEPRT
jgi:hypothetical protein